MVISALPRTGHLAIAERFASAPESWQVRPQFTTGSRWSRRLTTTFGVEVWLLTWLPGQGTEIHDHGGSAGAFTVVSGDLTEETYESVWPVGTHLRAGQGRSFGPYHVHRVVNQAHQPAVSVHVYSPELTSMTRYHVARGRLVVDGIERAGVQW